MAKKGKYAAITSKLPKLSLIEPGREDVINATKKLILEPASGNPPLDGEPMALLGIAEKALKRLAQFELTATGGKQYASEYARMYAEVRKIRDTIAALDSNFSILEGAYTVLMVEQFEIEGISSVKLDNGQPISTWDEPYATVTDQAAFRQWCLDNGLGNKLTMPWQTLNMITKEALLTSAPIPEGVSVSSKTKIRLGSE